MNASQNGQVRHGDRVVLKRSDDGKLMEVTIPSEPETAPGPLTEAVLNRQQGDTVTVTRPKHAPESFTIQSIEHRE